MENNNVQLLGLGESELEQFAIDSGQPSFRGRQLYQWLYKRGITDIDEVTVLPKNWRDSLIKQGITVGTLTEKDRWVAEDGTIKLLLATVDGELIETVGIPTSQRLTICISSQIGCSMACRFCATGKGGLQRSLKVNEIVAQFFAIKNVFGKTPSHIVFMGMGEPLLNIKAVLSSIRCFNQDLHIGQRRITVSTVGVLKSLPILAESALKYLGSVQFTLAVSLHAPNQNLRELLIPSAKQYHLNTLLNDCRHYIDITGRRVSFEYILLGDVNDQNEHAEELADLVAGFQSHINLIAYNPIEEETFKRPSLNRIYAFMDILKRRGVTVTFRKSRGLDKNAACGQLRHIQP